MPRHEIVKAGEHGGAALGDDPFGVGRFAGLPQGQVTIAAT
jgi:hypothetical protein